MTDSDYIKKRHATELRQTGYSLSEISNQLNISKSTASIWVRNIVVSKEGKLKILQKQIAGREKSLEILRNKKARIETEISSRSEIITQNFLSKDPDTRKILCSLLYWGEGGKKDSFVSFINSDPVMIKTFLTLFRTGFVLNESKFRALVHIHEYHSDKVLRKYWSHITGISQAQFTKSYHKPNTGINIHPNYMGTLKIKYYDYKIALELKALYNSLATNLGL